MHSKFEDAFNQTQQLAAATWIRSSEKKECDYILRLQLS